MTHHVKVEFFTAVRFEMTSEAIVTALSFAA
jgi:hypothetical protein